MHIKDYTQIRTAVLLAIFCLQLSLYSQNNIDSLLNILSQNENKSETYNLLSEAVLGDSLELSNEYAHKAFDYSIRENNLQQKGVAYFNMAEVFAYQYQLDSAKKYYAPALEIFKKTNDNFNASYTLNNMGWLSNSYGHFQDAVDYYTESLNYLDKEKHADELSHIYVNIGSAYYQLGKYKTAINYHYMAIAIAKKINYEAVFPYAYNGIGLAYKYLANYDSAIVYYKAMLEINKKSGNPVSLAIDFGNVGSLYYQWGQYEQALDYYNSALEIHKKHGTKSNLSSVLSNIGNVYRQQRKYEKALDYFNQALAIDSITGIELDKAVRFNNIGDVYFEKGNYKKALAYYQKSLFLNRKIEHRHNIAINLRNIGELFLKTNDYTKSNDYFEEGLLLAETLNTPSTVIEYLGSISELNQLSGNYKQSLIYHIRYTNLKDSIFKEKSQMALADMQTKYNLDKKEKEIVLLNNENKLHKLKADTYNTRLIFLISGLIIFSLLSFFLIVQYLHKNKAYIKLAERSKDFLEHEKQIKVLLSKSGNGISQKQNGNGNPAGSKHLSLMQQLLEYFEEEKPFLKQDINMKDIADHLKTNPKYISQAINANFNKNFNTFVNEHRIKLAMKYLANGVKKKYSIEGISEKVGFNSKSAFNVAFKKMTGVTPSFYIKSLKKKSEV